jgi:hypothetical protein
MKVPALLLSLAASFPCLAAEAVLADKLVATIGYREVSDRITQICLDEARKTDVEAALKQRPGLFGDIGPASPVWEDTRQAWIALVESNCYYTDQSKARKILSREYAAGLTNSEIEAALAFYQTPAGRKLRDVGISAVVIASQESSSLVAGDAAYEQYLLKLEDLMRKHHQLTASEATPGAR